MSGTSGRQPAALRALECFFTGWRFPLLVLATLGFGAGVLVTVVLVPPGDGALASFAEDFRRWCLGADATGGPASPGTVAMLLLQPVLLAAVTAAVWWAPLRELRARPRAALPWVAAALVLVVGPAVGFGMLRAPAPDAEPAFPADELRTAQAPPALALVDQDGAPATLASLRGRVVVVTAVYSSCGYTCPMILRQAKRVAAALTPAERADVTVLAITLDPEHDTPATLAEMARLQGVAAPGFRLLGGEPAAVNRVLDAFGFVRTRDPASGRIDHTNLFLVIDRAGRIAYRFSLGERQERWLETAVRLLVAEVQPLG